MFSDEGGDSEVETRPQSHSFPRPQREMAGIRLTNSEIQRAKYLKQKYDYDSTPNYLSLQSKALALNEVDETLVEPQPIIRAGAASR